MNRNKVLEWMDKLIEERKNNIKSIGIHLQRVEPHSSTLKDLDNVIQELRDVKFYIKENLK